MFKVIKSNTGKFLQKRFADARNQLTRPLWLAEEIWRQLLEFWESPEFRTQSIKNKVNWAANPKAAATVYHGGSTFVGAHKRKMEAFLRLLDGRQRQEPSSDETAPSSQASVAPNEEQLWMSAVGGRKRGRVFGLGSEAHNTIVGPSQPSSSTAPTPSPPQQKSPDLRDRVQMIDQYIKSRNPDWPDRLVPWPPVDPPAPTGDDDEHAAAEDLD
ncbi:UNVERIFIED_CONTAM: hypothetical protein Slati_2662300 [Sesamum latifolium]|uniref:Transposase n=1 Tax=Sesamum latifolium TaxID=2727402 RepID=A0AAW2VWK1_9LAMI